MPAAHHTVPHDDDHDHDDLDYDDNHNALLANLYRTILRQQQPFLHVGVSDWSNLHIPA
jgi:hypothetical protein